MMNTIAFFAISLIGYFSWRIARKVTQMKAVPVFSKKARRNNNG